MKRAMTPLVLAIFLTVAGCESSPRDGYITATITNMNASAADLNNISDNVSKALAKAQKENAKLQIADLKDAVAATDSLRTHGKDLQKLKLEADRLPRVEAADKDELTKRFQESLTRAIKSLDESKKRLNEVLVQADATGKEAVDELRTKIREAEGEFEVLTRQS